MNCGPLTLTDIDDSRADFEALPDIFMVNIDNGCYVSDSKDVRFSYLGNIMQINDVINVFVSPTDVYSAIDHSRPTELISATLPTSEPFPTYSFISQTRYSTTSQTRYSVSS